MDWSDRIGRRIKLRDLHILMAIADTGSMAKAAAKLRISHPAISKTISDIEGTLGVRLLDRGSQGAELTAYGEVLLRCGTNIFDEMQQGLRSLEYLSDPNSGEVRWDAPTSFCTAWCQLSREDFPRNIPAFSLT
jgi:DNA-binding transcriptional LysR family regulator